MRTLASAPPEASQRPSRLNATQFTESELPVKVRSVLPEERSHSLIV